MRIAVIQRETDMLGRMIADLFTLTRIGERSLRLERKAIDLAALASKRSAGSRISPGANRASASNRWFRPISR